MLPTVVVVRWVVLGCCLACCPACCLGVLSGEGLFRGGLFSLAGGLSESASWLLARSLYDSMGLWSFRPLGLAGYVSFRPLGHIHAMGLSDPGSFSPMGHTQAMGLADRETFRPLGLAAYVCLSSYAVYQTMFV